MGGLVGDRHEAEPAAERGVGEPVGEGQAGGDALELVAVDAADDRQGRAVRRTDQVDQRETLRRHRRRWRPAVALGWVTMERSASRPPALTSRGWIVDNLTGAASPIAAPEGDRVVDATDAPSFIGVARARVDFGGEGPGRDPLCGRPAPAWAAPRPDRAERLRPRPDPLDRRLRRAGHARRRGRPDRRRPADRDGRGHADVRAAGARGGPVRRPPDRAGHRRDGDRRRRRRGRGLRRRRTAAGGDRPRGGHAPGQPARPSDLDPARRRRRRGGELGQVRARRSRWRGRRAARRGAVRQRPQPQALHARATARRRWPGRPSRPRGRSAPTGSTRATWSPTPRPPGSSRTASCPCRPRTQGIFYARKQLARIFGRPHQQGPRPAAPAGRLVRVQARRRRSAGRRRRRSPSAGRSASPSTGARTWPATNPAPGSRIELRDRRARPTGR